MKKFIYLTCSLFLLYFLSFGCSSSSSIEEDLNLEPLLSIENGATGVPVDQVITVTFLQSVNEASVNADTFFFVELTSIPEGNPSYDSDICNINNSEVIRGQVLCETETVCSLSPTELLSSNTTYAVCLSDSISYLDTTMYPGSMIFFTTADVTAPVVRFVSPENSATDISINVSAEITFSEKLDLTTVNDSNFYITGEEGIIDVNVELNNDLNLVTITPNSDFTNFSTYTVYVTTSVTDLAGNNLEQEYSFSFTTSDFIAPEANLVIPETEVDVVRDSLITVSFSLQMDANTINEDTFRVLTDFGAVNGRISYDRENMKVVFVPETPFFGDSKVNISLSNNIKSLDNKSLNRTYAWAFSTEMPNPFKSRGGYKHSLVIAEDGTLWSFGANGYGQLGDGTKIPKASRVRVKNSTGNGFLTNVIDVAGGSSHSIALLRDGTVMTWGDNYYGQLGNGTTTDSILPVQVRSLNNVIAIAAGGFHSVALKNDGSVWTWGRNNYGQLGDGNTGNRMSPVSIFSLENIIAIDSRTIHTVALREDGTVWAWGANMFGQLGDGTRINRTIPVRASGLTGIVSVMAGGQSSYAITSTEEGRRVYSWGNNTGGQLGDGTRIQRILPIEIPDLSGIDSIYAGWYHVMALSFDGTVYVWGDNKYGNAGIGSDEKRIVSPVIMEGITGVANVGVGGYHSMMILNNGKILSWGFNYDGQLGDSSATFYGSSPQIVSEVSNIIDVKTGYGFAIALTIDGHVYTAGLNANGQLGDSTTDSKNDFSLIEGLSDVTAICSGGRHSLALLSDGTVMSWGANSNGQLGLGDTVQHESPVMVTGDGEGGVLRNVTNIACGWEHSLAIKADGTLWSWGRNTSGELGINSRDVQRAPAQVVGPDGVGFLTTVQSVSGGQLHSIASLADGSVYAWGVNASGQLGTGGMENSNAPIEVAGLFNITEVIAGWQNSAALNFDGNVFMWGDNSIGQLGLGTIDSSLFPSRVRGENGIGFMRNAAKISGFGYTFASVKTDSTLSTWGLNEFGMIGDGTNADKLLPISILDFNDIRTISFGVFYQSFAVKNDGSLWKWGWNQLVPLGDGTIPYKSSPVDVVW